MFLHFCLKVFDAVVTPSILLGDILQTLGALYAYPSAIIKMLTVLRPQKLVCASFGCAPDLDAQAFFL
jgi:hypothetical protein